MGISSDELNLAEKGWAPVFDQDERVEIVGCLKGVDQVFVEESLEKKRDYVVEHGADTDAPVTGMTGAASSTG